MTNVLFICSRNQWRSPTAETLWRNRDGLHVRSAGTSPRARRTVNQGDIRWADVILVMEYKHKTRLQATFSRLLAHKLLHVLDIPDDYTYMDLDLVVMLERAVADCLWPQASA